MLRIKSNNINKGMNMCKKLCIVFLIISFISCAKPENQKQDIAICPCPAEVHPVEKDPYEKCGKVTLGEGCVLKCDEFSFSIECQQRIAKHYIEVFHNYKVESFIEMSSMRSSLTEKAIYGRYKNPVDFSKRHNRVRVGIVFPDNYVTHINLSVY
jgi:hypothetical protein